LTFVFKELLKDIVDGLPGAAGAILADWEGESVDFFFRGPDYDIKLLGAHHGILLNLAKEASDNNGLGDIRALMVSMGEHRVVVQPLKDGYYLVLLLDRGANGGQALRVAGIAATRLIEEI